MANLRDLPGQGGTGYSPISVLCRRGRSSAAALITDGLYGLTTGLASTTSTKCYASSWFAGNTTTPNNAIGAPDNVFTTDTGATNWYGQWNMTAPPALLGGRVQTVRIHCRSSAANYSYPDTLDVYYNNTFLGSGVMKGINDVLGTGGRVVTFEFDGALLTAVDLVQFGINVINGGATCQVDAIEWEANHNLVVVGGSKPVKYWTGSAWVTKPLKYWTGAAWVTKPLKYWTGSAWV